MDKIFEKAIKAKIEKTQKDLRTNIDNIKQNLDDIMLKHIENGFFGFQLMQDPFLIREECLELLGVVSKEIKEMNYRLVINDTSYIITILPNIKTKGCLVNFGDKSHYIPYTIDDKKRDIENKWKDNINKKIEHIENRINELWYAPNMPGFEKTFQNFEKLK